MTSVRADGPGGGADPGHGPHAVPDRERRPGRVALRLAIRAAVAVLLIGLLGLWLARPPQYAGWLAHSLVPLTLAGWFVARSTRSVPAAFAAVGLTTLLALVVDDAARVTGAVDDLTSFGYSASWRWIAYPLVAAVVAAAWVAWRRRDEDAARSLGCSAMATLSILLAAACFLGDGDASTLVALAGAAVVLALDRRSLRDHPRIAAATAAAIAIAALALYGLPRPWGANPARPIGASAVTRASSASPRPAPEARWPAGARHASPHEA